MLILSSTTDKIEAVTSTAASIDRALFYTKLNLAATPVVDDAQVVSGNIAAASTVSLSGFPGSATDRWAIVGISLRNKDATLSCVVTVRHVKAAGTAVELYSCTLLPGEELKLDKNGVWFHYDANGGVYGAVAMAMKRTVLNSGSAATYTTPPGCRAIDAEVRAAGGAGGGATLVASSGGAGGGGGEGGLTRKLISPPAASYTYTIGAGGTGVSGATGNAGGDTTFGTLTAKGGSGGLGATSAAATRALGGAGGLAGSGGDTNDVGAPGEAGVVMTAALVASGAGGGKGANGVTAQGAGGNAVANSGGGGSGGASVSGGAAVAGGAGGSGIVIVTEFY